MLGDSPITTLKLWLKEVVEWNPLSSAISVTRRLIFFRNKSIEYIIR